MFLKFRWLELAYLFSGHIVVLLTVVLTLSAIIDVPMAARAACFQKLEPYLLVLVPGLVVVCCTFLFAVVCSTAPLLLMLGYPKQAERVYRFTLSLRQKSPVGKARSNFWNVSIANCLREQGRFPQAEVLYKTVLDSPESPGFLDRLTNYGLAEAAAENYARLLVLQNRTAEAEAVATGIGKELTLLRVKYALVSFSVLAAGTAFAFWLRLQLLSVLK